MLSDQGKEFLKTNINVLLYLYKLGISQLQKFYKLDSAATCDK